jgi:CheY-like chemotaxis protein
MKVLVVDDEPANLELLSEYLKDDGFEVIMADNGSAGWEKLQENPDISVILLDKMMPKVCGMEFMSRLYIDGKFKDVPVIMQTAAADTDSIIEGVNAGVYYYLTKPYKKEILLSIVHSAVNDNLYMRDIISEVHNSKKILGFMKKAYFEIQTMDEAQSLAYVLANSFPDPERVVLGLSEILMNAVEHGNLKIGYKGKSELMLSGNFLNEARRRAELPENKNKKVSVWFELNEVGASVIVKDEGDGFDSKEFIELRPERATKPNGRGIVMAKMISFDEMEYRGCGNEVVCWVFKRPQ